jgi:hypothetical protein
MVVFIGLLLKQDKTMERYRDFRPTGFDAKGLGAHKHRIGYWYVFPIILTRDADILTQSNFEVISKDLGADKVPGVVIHSFNHWGCGTFDLILINPWNKSAVDKAYEWENALSTYPVADEDHFSNMEWEARSEYVANDGISDLSARLSSDYGLDLDNVPHDDMWVYFDKLEERANVQFDADQNWIDIRAMAAKSSFLDCLINLPGARVNIDEDNPIEITDQQWHYLIQTHVTALIDSNDERIDPPTSIALWYDKRQSRLFPDSAITSKE